MAMRQYQAEINGIISFYFNALKAKYRYVGF